MHSIIQEGLEDYLAGRVDREFENHLNQCAGCRVELDDFGSISVLFGQLSDAPEEMRAPAPGFYARLAQNIEFRKSVSPWSFFSIDAVFGRRVAFGSLLALALMGSFLISRESDAVIDLQPGPEALIAQHDPAPHDAAIDRDRMMIALAGYER